MSDKNIITINISEEARELRDFMLAQQLNSYLKEEGFEQSLEELKYVEAQILPEAEYRNTIEKEVVDGCNVYSFSVDGYENSVLYLHGGAWVYELFPDHVVLCDDIAEKVNAKVYAPLYPLAPAYSYKETYKMVVELYDRLIEKGKPVFIMGDSAGGNIALGLMHIIKETGRKPPEGIAALSPCVDMTLSNPEALEVEKIDPLDAVYGCREFGKMWAKGADLNEPVLSPLNADVSGYPRTLLLAASDDILTPDILKFYDKLEENGIDTTLVRGEGLFHVFPTQNIPERETFLNILKDFCLK